MYQKGFAPILIILFLAVAIGGYFIYQNQTAPSVSNSQLSLPKDQCPLMDCEFGCRDSKCLSKPDTTAGWETYTNSELGFSFRYPTNLVFKETDQRKQGGSFFVALAHTSEKQDLFSIHLVQIAVYQTSMTIDEHIDKDFCDMGRCASAKQAIPLDLGGIQAKKIVNNPAPVDSDVVVAKAGEYLITVSIVYDEKYQELYTKDQKQQLFNQILSTFKFTQ